MVGERDYSNIPPEKINEYLIRMVEQIPSIQAGSEGETRDDQAEHFQETFLRRRRSETLKIFVSDLEKMSPRSQATDGAKIYLEMSYSSAYASGQKRVISWAIQEVNHDSAGFYSPNIDTVCEIERRGYRVLSAVLLRQRIRLGTAFLPDNHAYVVLASNWREQFIKKYGDEP